MPLLLVGLALLALVTARGALPTRHLDLVIVAASGLGLLRAPAVGLTAPTIRIAVGALTMAIGLVGAALWRRPRLAGARALGAVIALWAVVGAVVIVASPQPRIDVFVLEQGGARALVHGENPYSVTYANPYSPEEAASFFGDQRTALREYPYPPLSLAITALGYVVAGDVRWALLVTELLLPLLLFFLAKRCGQTARMAFGLAILQLVHPRGAFMLEQAWTDGLVGCAFLFVLLLLTFPAPTRLRSGWLGGLAMGLFFAFKQYTVLLVPLLWPRRVVPRSWWIPALLVASAVTLPALAFSPHDFLEDVVLFQLRQPPRADAMSLPGLLQSLTGIRLPGVLAVLGAGSALVYWWRRRVEVASLALASAGVYGAFFVTAKQAFCNYYYFLGILLLAAAAMAQPAEDEGAVERRIPAGTANV